MNRDQFFDTYRPRVRAVYRTLKPVTVETYVWIPFRTTPKDSPQTFTIPAGTELVVCDYSQLDNGYSMYPRNYRKVFSGKNASHRWFECKFENMEFVRNETV